MNTEQTNKRRPQVVWVPVRDRAGRVHMEARWELHRTPRTHAA